MKKQSIDYHFSHLNADSGFDVKSFLVFIEQMDTIPNIKQNKRNTRKQSKPIVTRVTIFMQTDLKLSRTDAVVFAWLDTYKRILVRFEKFYHIVNHAVGNENIFPITDNYRYF